MAVKRKQYKLRNGRVIDVEEFHDGNYGSPGTSRMKKKKPTVEQMQRVNRENKMRRCRQRLLEYFEQNDILATWTYTSGNRPSCMSDCKQQFQKAMRIVRREYKKRGKKAVFFIKNIEKGTKGAFHIHLVINEIGDTCSIIQKAWEHGGTWSTSIKLSNYYDEDFTKLAYYMTKDENCIEQNADGTLAKPRIKESSYSTSRNMPLPEPKVDKLLRWKEEPKPRKGYYIARIHEGINPITGFKYRRYTMISLNKERIGEENAKSRRVHKNRKCHAKKE